MIKIWIHAVWATKNREPFLKKGVRKEIFNHIKENAWQKGIHLDFINGYDEHVHCLISIKSDQSMDKIVQLIKGESSFWINKNKLCDVRFSWQKGYFAASVSYSRVDGVREYIKNQEVHHDRQTYEKEIDSFIRLHGLENVYNA